MRQRTCVVAVVAVAICIQGGGAQNRQEPPVVFRAQSRLVEISVVVRDSNGNPVKDLKREDFAVYDNGKKQDIRVFRMEEYGGRAQAQKPAPAAPPRAPLAFSNRRPLEAAAPNPPTVLVIDAANTWNIARMTWPDLVYARDQVIRFLRQLRPDDRIGIYILGPKRFWIVREYDEPCADLLERLEEWKGPGAEPGSNKYGDVWTEFAVRLGRIDESDARQIHRGQFWDLDATPSAVRGDSVRTLRAVARHLDAVPGRKNIILVSGTLFLPSEPKEVLGVLNTVAASNIAMYTIDPGGLAPYAIDASFVVPSAVTAFRDPSQPREDVLAQRYADAKYAETREMSILLQASLTALAKATGGRAFVNTNDVMGGIRRSFEDSQVSYTVGYYPDRTGSDGEYHAVRVKVRGRGRLALRHRAGYYDDRPVPHDSERRYYATEQLVWSPVDATAIEVNAGVQRAAGEGVHALDLRIGVGGLAIATSGDRTTARIEVLVVQRDLNGGEFEPSLQTLQLSLKPDSWAEAVARGFAHRVALKLNPKAVSVRVVVRDLASGQAGTLTIPVEAFRGA